MAARTRSSRNARAWFALLFGLVATAALPGSIAISQALRAWRLLASFGAVPVAAVAGITALLFARGARRKVELTLGRAPGAGLARAGRLLGILGLYIAATGLLTLGVYFLLSRFVER